MKEGPRGVGEEKEDDIVSYNIFYHILNRIV